LGGRVEDRSGRLADGRTRRARGSGRADRRSPPPGGVWVPQQRDRDGEQFPPIPQDEPHRPGYPDPDYNEQRYRY
ncbi:hypothetical protein ACFRFS_35470, partial [Streptomyces sp. NPDC056730]